MATQTTQIRTYRSRERIVTEWEAQMPASRCMFARLSGRSRRARPGTPGIARMSDLLAQATP